MKRPLGFLVTFFLSTSAVLAQLYSLDPMFGNVGQMRFDAGYNTRDVPGSIVIQKDSKIVLSGTTYVWGDYVYSAAVFRINPGGDIDEWFGTNGVVVNSWFIANSIDDIAIDSNERLIACGKVTLVDTVGDIHYLPILYCFLPTNGMLDQSFGNVQMGQAFQTMGGDNGFACNIFASRDRETIFMTGKGETYTEDNIEDYSTCFGVAKLGARGLLDTFFSPGYDKKWPVGFTPTASMINRPSAVLTTDEKLFMAAQYYGRNALTYPITLARVTSEGRYDSTLGQRGLKYLDLNATGGIVALSPQYGDFIYILYSSQDSASQPRYISVVKWNNSINAIDSTFGAGGIAKVMMPYSLQGRDIVQLSNGKILIAGSSDNESGHGFLAQFHESGELDRGFCYDGIMDVNLNSNAGQMYFKKILLDPHSEKSFYVMGYDEASNRGDILLLKYIVNPTSVDTASQQPTTIFPNPATRTLNIRSACTILSVHISDVLGRAIVNLPNTSPDAFHVSYEISMLSSGLYYATIETTNGRTVKQFIITR